MRFQIQVFDCETSWNGIHPGEASLEATKVKAADMHRRLGGDIEVYEVPPSGDRMLRGRYRG